MKRALLGVSLTLSTFSLAFVSAQSFARNSTETRMKCAFRYTGFLPSFERCKSNWQAVADAANAADCQEKVMQFLYQRHTNAPANSRPLAAKRNERMYIEGVEWKINDGALWNSSGLIDLR